MYPKCQSAPNVNPPRMSECAQCECPQNVRVCPKCQSASSVDVPKMSVCPMQMHPKCQSVPNVDLPKMSECTQNVRVPAMWIHTHFLGGYFCAQIFRVHPRSMCQCWRIFWVVISTPNLSEWSHNVRVHPIWMHPKCQSAPNVNAPRMSGSAQCESAQNIRVPYQIWKGAITHGQHEMAHCNTLISNTSQQK